MKASGSVLLASRDEISELTYITHPNCKVLPCMFLYLQINLKVFLNAICKALYIILTNKKNKSTELHELTRSGQSSEILDACQLLFNGQPPTRHYSIINLFPVLSWKFLISQCIPLTVIVNMSYHYLDFSEDKHYHIAEKYYSCL